MAAKKKSVRRFEFNDEKSSKFWEISTSGKGFTVRFGKIGSNGQTQSKEFADVDAAGKQVQYLINEKLGKGYCEITKDLAPTDSVAKISPSKKTAAKPVASNDGVVIAGKQTLGSQPLPPDLIYLRDWATEISQTPEGSCDPDYFESLLEGINGARLGSPIKWKEVGLREADRLGTLLYGPHFCSKKHPWPNVGGKPMLPWLQLNLNECREKFELPEALPDGLLQVFMPQGEVMGKNACIRVIEPSDYIDAEATPFPMLSTGEYSTHDWTSSQCVIKQAVDFGDPRIYFGTGIDSIKKILRNKNIKKATELSKYDAARLGVLANNMDKLASKFSTNLMGSFYPIQYRLIEVKGEPLLCISEEDWGYGNAQIFFKVQRGKANFFIDWSC